MATKREIKNLKPKIAIFHCAFVYSGGGERIVIEEVLGLRERGYEVDLFAPAINQKNCYPPLLKEAKPKSLLPQLPEGFPLRDAISMAVSSLFVPFLAPRFRKYDFFVGANQPGVWFSYVLSRLLRKPYVIYLNQPNRMIYPRSIDLKTGWRTNTNFLVLEKGINFFKPIVAWLDKKSVRGAKTILTNGRYIGQVIGQIYGRGFVSCPAGADSFPLERIEPVADTYYKGSIKVNGRTLEKPYILLTNRHYPQKKFEYALEALREVFKGGLDTRLAITGATTAYTRSLQQLADKLGVEDKAIFLGEVSDDDLSHLYQQAAVYVYTSPQEDYGMGVVEAQYAGVPVVAWKAAGPTFTVVDGETGFLAKLYDILDYTNKITTLLKNKDARIKMGKNARTHAQKNFSWRQHVDILEEAVLGGLGKDEQR